MMFIYKGFTKSGGNRNLPEYLVALYLDMFLACKTHVASGYSRSTVISWVFWNIHHQSMEVPKMEVLFQSHPKKMLQKGVGRGIPEAMDVFGGHIYNE